MIKQKRTLARLFLFCNGFVMPWRHPPKRSSTKLRFLCGNSYHNKINTLQFKNSRQNGYLFVLFFVSIIAGFFIGADKCAAERRIQPNNHSLTDELFIAGPDFAYKSSGCEVGNYWQLDVAGKMEDTVSVKSSGAYFIAIQFYSHFSGNSVPLLSLKIDSVSYYPVKIKSYSDDKRITFFANINPGKHSFAIFFSPEDAQGVFAVKGVEFRRIENPYLILAEEYAATVMAKMPDPGGLGLMDWRIVNLLFGISKVYEETQDDRYLNYIRKWSDRHISDDGEYDCQIDDVFPASIITWLARKVGDIRYGKFLRDSQRMLESNYPKNKDGIYFHVRDEIWDDTVAGVTRFLIQRGISENAPEAFNQAAFQIIGHARILQDENTGLFYHAYDTDGSQWWADPITHLSPEFWGRGNGWLAQACADLLTYLPDTSRYKNQISEIQTHLLQGLFSVQTKDCLWKTVLRKTDDPNNYYENSATCLYVYALERMVREGKLGHINEEEINRIWTHLMTYLYKDANGNWHLTHVSKGTGPGDYQHYLQIPFGDAIDDYFGSGLFLEALIEKHRVEKSTRICRGDISYFSNQYPVYNVEIAVRKQLQSFRIFSTTDGSFAFSYKPMESVRIGFYKPPVSQNDFILMYDAALAARYSVGLCNLSNIQQLAADVSDNGSVQMYDASMIARTVVNMPVGGNNRIGEWGFWPDSLFITDTQCESPKILAFVYGDVHGDWRAQTRSLARRKKSSKIQLKLIKINAGWVFAFPVAQKGPLISFTTAWDVPTKNVIFEKVQASSNIWQNRIYSGIKKNQMWIGSFSLNKKTKVDSLYFYWKNKTGKEIGKPPQLESLFLNGEKIPFVISESKTINKQSLKMVAFPNPFNGKMTVEYYLQKASRTRISVFNLQGRIVKTLVDALQKPGTYRLSWEGKNQWGQPVGSGIYFILLETMTKRYSEKILLLK